MVRYQIRLLGSLRLVTEGLITRTIYMADESSPFTFSFSAFREVRAPQSHTRFEDLFMIFLRNPTSLDWGLQGYQCHGWTARSGLVDSPSFFGVRGLESRVL